MSDVGAAREALLAEARQEADRLLAEAEAEARAILERAGEHADTIVSRAREDGRAEGRVAASREEAQARMLARLEVLAARREVYEELGRRARAAALALRDDPGYPTLLERLAAAARRDLGAAAEVETDPDGAGGVRARAGSRRVDYTLATLADRCLRGLGPTARRLWE
jgi:vacuolar-type H+-ATPase subunit E/Vma4